MLKLTMMVKRQPHLTREEFDRHWRDVHGPLVSSHRDVLRIKRYVQTTPLDKPEIQEAIRAGRGALKADFDGCAELWWDSFEDHIAARSTAEGLAALRELMIDERKFVDLSHSQLWYGTSREVIPA